MPFIERLNNWFGRRAQPTEHTLRPDTPAIPVMGPPATAVQPLPYQTQPYAAQPSAAQPILAVTHDTEPLPDWLEDEELLRDEGVIFGLSESKAEEKTAVIRTFFQRQNARLEREIDQHNERIGELNLLIGEREERINALRGKITHLEAQRPEGDHQLPRTIAGLMLSVLMGVGTYYLVEDTLRPVFGESRLISVGVFLAGMFSLFSRTSLFHEKATPATARRLLEEIGLPLAASLFVFIQAVQTQPFLRAASLWLFLFFLFLLGGKLLLGTLTILRNDLRYWRQSQRIDRDQKTKIGAWEREIVQLNADIDALRLQKWQVVPALNRADAELQRSLARRDMLIHLFESEFNLARSLRNQLTENQRRTIRGE